MVPVPGQITIDDVASHVMGKIELGIYILRSDSTCLVTCIDIDNHDGDNQQWWGQTWALADRLTRCGLCPHIEISKSGSGAHVWLFLEYPIEGWWIRQFWKSVEKKFSFPFNEIFPKQDNLDGIEFGNFVRLPYAGDSHFVDASRRSIVPRYDVVTREDLVYALSLIGEPEPQQLETTVEGSSHAMVSPRVTSLLSNEHSVVSRLWKGEDTGLKDTSRSARVQAMALQLLRSYVQPAEVVNALIYWCHEVGYEKGLRDGFVDKSIEKAYNMLGGGNKKKPSLKTSTDCAMAYVDKLKHGGMLIGSGVPAIDKSIEGVSNGEMAILAARPSNGKSALALQWLTSAAKEGTNCLLLSAEMSSTEIGKRIIMHSTDMPEDLWADHPDDVKEAVSGLKGELWVEDVCASIDEIDTLIDTHTDINNVKLVAIDYMQLINAGKTGSRYEAVTEISQRVKAAAKRNDVAILALCQMGRQSEFGDEWNPGLSDLKESGQLEQDADLVIFCKWGDRDAQESNYWFSFAKRRNGNIKNTGAICTFDSDRQLFRTPIAEQDGEETE